MIKYVKAHWHGELSLARSYWANGILLSAVSGVVGSLLEQPLSELPPLDAVISGWVLIMVAAAVSVWQLVGIWRSATNTSIKTGRTFWPKLAKAATVLGSLMATSAVLTTSSDLMKIFFALRDPTLTEYSIERIGDTDIIFSGAINENSASRS